MRTRQRIMRALVLLLAAVTLMGPGCSGKNKNRVTLQGNGATFPDPLYQEWFAAFGKEDPDVRINYQPEGSSAGISAFEKGTVFFAGSDAVTEKDTKSINDNLVTLPLTAGSIVIAYNVKDTDGNKITGLKLSRKAYADIFRGAIKKWNDPEIAEQNKGVKLPNRTVSVVCRLDGSGTTYNFTHHLSTISPEFKKDPGEGKTVKWPEGDDSNFSAAKGNAGITAQLDKSDGSIGYIEYGFAMENKVETALLENKKGKYVKADEKSGQAALASLPMTDDMRVSVPDPTGDESYPIVTYTWLLVKQKYDDGDAKKVEKLKDVLRYCLSEEGQKVAPTKGYIPLPKNVTDKVLKAVESIKP